MPTTKNTVKETTSIYADAAHMLGAKNRVAVQAIYDYVELARDIANDKDGQRAGSELAELRRQTEDAVEIGRSLNPVIKAFGEAVRKYKIDQECIEVLFESLYMDTVNTTFTSSEYKRYIAGVGEAVGLMVLRVLCYKRAVLYHKLMPAGRAFGAAICKVNLVLDHGRTHKRHGRMYFPDVTKSTFNQARLAQVIVDIEADFRVARSGIASLPTGTKTAATLLYVYYYELLRQIRTLTPAQIDAGMAKVSPLQKLWFTALCYVAPSKAIMRGQRY